MLHLVTGKSEKEHIASGDIGLMQAGIVGAEDYRTKAGDQLQATVISANEIQIGTGAIFTQGRFVINTMSVVITIENGSQSLNRNDLIGIRYTKDEITEVEKDDWVVLRGATSTAATDPNYTRGDLFAGATEDFLPVLRIPIVGLTPGTPVQLLPIMLNLASIKLPLSLDNGGTGGTTAATARSKLGVPTLAETKLGCYPVGAVYIAYAATSPASLFGGTWTAITGRFPYFNAGTATGGANTHSLTIAETAAHTHNGHSASFVDKASNDNGVANRYCIANGGTASTANIVLTSPTGGGAAHNNMPAYQTLYAWRRTA